ncbi:MAG: exodeoxyribonuclease VII large subunit [Anaerolineae bacterium]
MPPVFSVADVTGYIKELLEADFQLQDVWLTGEVSNLSRSTAGHVYFTLKDDAAQIRCVIWRSQMRLLDRVPAHGEAVVVHGRISVYAAGGQYQLSVDALQAAGQGVLHAQFEALRDKLHAEGLFAVERKRPLPGFPRHIGVVTSPQAAAWRDVQTTLGRRWPLARVTLAPTLVQGADAPPAIVAALARLNALPDVEVILLVRGGGSLEDLWAFNEEMVARAVAASRVPVVTGVGHETDFTIVDFVSDVRAATPTAAAEMATPDRLDLRRRVADARDALDAAVEDVLGSHALSLDHQQRHLERLSPQARIDAARMRLSELARRAASIMTHRLALARAETQGQSGRLATLDPNATLRRGYAIVTDAESGEVVRETRQARVGRGLRVHVADGAFEVTVGRQRRLLD